MRRHFIPGNSLNQTNIDTINVCPCARNINKKVIYPYIWFNFGPDTSQIGCENWIKI